MLKRVQHDKKKYVIPSQALNLALKQVQGLLNSERSSYESEMRIFLIRWGA